MKSPDIDIFIKEYVALQERIRRLGDHYMRVKSSADRFTVPIEIIYEQLIRENDSLLTMQKWARFEGIDLSKYDIDIPDGYY